MTDLEPADLQPVRMNDIRLLSIAMKTLLVGYAADLLFGDLRPEIFLHHFFTFALLFVGQLAAFQTKSASAPFPLALSRLD